MHDAAGFPRLYELDRGAIGDREGVRYDDGSLGILIQYERTEDGPSHRTAGARGRQQCRRLASWPEPEVPDGRWAPPAIR